MEVAFIVKLDIDQTDPTTLAGYAEDIEDSLNTDGLPVLTVTPWTRPTEPQISTPFTMGIEPQNKTEQTNSINKLQL